MGAEITLDDLQTTADAQGVTVAERDILLVRTGSMGHTRDPEAAWNPTDEPGLAFSEELVEWVHDRDIAALGADNVAIERVTQRIDGETYVLPLHGAFLRNLGLPLVEMLWLDDLAAACTEDGIYEFLLTAAPLHIQRATGGPTNPVVLKATDGD
jgi:kynurenine formamidase